MFKGDLGHRGGQACCHDFVAFENVGSHCDNGGGICAVPEHKLSSIIAASWEINAKAWVGVDFELVKEEFAKLRECEVLGFVVVIATNTDFG